MCPGEGHGAPPLFVHLSVCGRPLQLQGPFSVGGSWCVFLIYMVCGGGSYRVLGIKCPPWVWVGRGVEGPGAEVGIEKSG